MWIGFHIHQIVVAAGADAAVADVAAEVVVFVADAEGDVVVVDVAAADDGDDEQGL